MANDGTPNALALVKQQIFAPETTSQFRMALPAHIPVERFQRVALTAIANNPDLLRADRRSLFNACGKAAQDGLLPDGREAALVMFGQQAQYMPMVAGVLKKVRNSGELAAISAHVVYSRDRFVMKLGDSEELIHEPPPLGEDRGEIVGAYAVATLKNGEKMREIMSKKDIERVRAVSRAKNGGPWSQWWEEMAKKTVIRRLSKRLPMSTDRDEAIRRVIERDDEMTDLNAQSAAPEADAASAVQAALMAPADVSEIDPETGEVAGEAPYQPGEKSINDADEAAAPAPIPVPSNPNGKPDWAAYRMKIEELLGMARETAHVQALRRGEASNLARQDMPQGTRTGIGLLFDRAEARIAKAAAA